MLSTTPRGTANHLTTIALTFGLLACVCSACSPEAPPPVGLAITSESIDQEKCSRLYAHLAEHDTWVVPTLITQRMARLRPLHDYRAQMAANWPE